MISRDYYRHHLQYYFVWCFILLINKQNKTNKLNKKSVFQSYLFIYLFYFLEKTRLDIYVKSYFVGGKTHTKNKTKQKKVCRLLSLVL